MKIQFGRLVSLLALSALAVSVTACGGGAKTEGAAKFMNAMTSSGSGAQMMRAKLAKQALRDAQSEAIYRYLTDNTPASSRYSATGSFGGCTDSAASATEISISCTTPQDLTNSCGGTSYTLKAGATFGFTMNFSNLTAMSLGLTFVGTMDGGEFSNTTVDCAWNFTYNTTQAQTGDYENAITVDCTNTANRCIIGGETISCAEMRDAQVETADDCSAAAAI